MVGERRLTTADVLGIYRPADREPMHLSPHGSLLAVTVRSGAPGVPAEAGTSYSPDGVPLDKAGSRILVVDVESGDQVQPFADAEISWGARWSPDGSVLAGYVGRVGQRPHVGVWHRQTGGTLAFPDAVVRPFFGFEVPQWLPDGRAVVVKLAPSEEQPRLEDAAADATQAGITVWTTDPDKGADASLSTGFMETFRCDLATVDVTSGEVRRLMTSRSLIGWRVAPDGHAVAALLDVGWQLTGDEFYSDLVVVGLDGTTRTLAPRVCQEEAQGFSWSPDSSRLAYVTQHAQDRTRLFVVASEGHTSPLELTADADVARLPELLPGAYDAPRWSADGQHLLLPARGGYVEFDTGTPSKTRVVETGDQRKFVGWMQPWSEPTLAVETSRAVLDVVRDADTKGLVVRRVDLDTATATDLRSIAAEWIDPSFGIELQPDLSRVYLWLGTADHPPQVAVFDRHFLDKNTLFDPNPQLQGVAMGSTRLVTWRAADGRRLSGTLLQPVRSESTPPPVPAPLVVDVYGGRLGSNHRHTFGGRLIFNGQLLANHGYAVLWPDMPMTGPDPLRQLPGLITPAVDELVAAGVVDRKRVGVMGQSYGGYCALGLLTQTSLFRAGVCTAGSVDLVSAYGTLTPRGDSQWIGWLESGDGRLGGSCGTVQRRTSRTPHCSTSTTSPHRSCSPAAPPTKKKWARQERPSAHSAASARQPSYACTTVRNMTPASGPNAINTT